MAKLQGFKRIQTEDFPKEYQSVIDRLGYSINVFAEQVLDAFNKKIMADDRVEQVILPIRDGLSLIRKK